MDPAERSHILNPSFLNVEIECSACFTQGNGCKLGAFIGNIPFNLEIGCAYITEGFDLNIQFNSFKVGFTLNQKQVFAHFIG